MDDTQNQGRKAKEDRAINSEPIRSRWSPKPEQIQILENIFNSGTVNPSKDETIRIRKILEQYGSVGDANVFYWFQNRRSRSRRRQRQLQAAAAAAAAAGSVYSAHGIYETAGSSSSPSNSSATSSSSGYIGDDSLLYGDDLFSMSRQIGFTDYSSSPSQLQYQSAAGTITVFINGIPSEVPKGPFDLRAMFGHDLVLVHSSGELLPINDSGILLEGLQMGESYFWVSKPT